jgi:hypothetical protein
MKKILTLALSVFFLVSCKKEVPKNCEGLKTAIQTDNLEEVKNIVELLTSDLASQPTADDPTGHRQNFQTLVNRLNDCDVKATAVCYECIDTLPATSEIKLVIAQGSHTVIRIIDILPDQRNRLKCSNMHE